MTFISLFLLQCECWYKQTKGEVTMSTKMKDDEHITTMGKSKTKRTEKSKPDSERDSGFSGLYYKMLSKYKLISCYNNNKKKTRYNYSLICLFVDASSEHLSVVDQADSEDAARPVMQAASGSRSQSSQLAVIGGSFQSLSPMIIMNNVLLKQVKTTFLWLFSRSTVPQPWHVIYLK